MNHLLIFEPENFGHQPLYIRLLYIFILENKLDIKVTFVIHPGIIHRVETEDKIQLRTIEDKVYIVLLKDAEIASSSHNNLWIRALNRWYLMKKYLKKTSATQGHFLQLDLIQLPLALKLPFLPGKKISGLLFQPPMLDFYGGKKNFKERIRNYRKKWFYARMLKNKHLSFVYSLNPLFPDYARKFFSNGKKVYHLPDPSMFPNNRVNLAAEDCSIIKNLKKTRKIFLLFGALTNRKGIFKIIEALSHLEQDYISRIALVFAGKLEDKIRFNFIKAVKYYKNNNPDACIHIEDRFLSTNEIICLLQHCNIVLAPYSRDFTGSSGVLLWAAGAKRPVITSNYGLLGYQSQKYNLGISVDTTNSELVAEAFRCYLDDSSAYEQNISGMQQLYKESLPEKFGQTFFSKFFNT